MQAAVDVTVRNVDAMLEHERVLYDAGIRVIAGVDEAGRGSLAGPVVAGAVVFPPIDSLAQCPPFYREIQDSKKLTPKKREQTYTQILQDETISVGVGIVDETVIDDINILQATFRAMRLALADLPVEPDVILVDGTEVPALSKPHRAIVGGDAASISIAAASIVAKVVRDRIMVKYDAAYPLYGFKVHKGYGTKRHMDALRTYGPCQIHRRTFEPVRQLTFGWPQ